MPSKTLIALMLVFGLALFTRLIAITNVPLSLNWDEVTFAYNAFSLMETGRDEYGKILPLEFQSVGDFKAPMYVYLLVPAIKAIGLNELAVRAIPAILGALTVPALFMIAYSLFGSKKLALCSAFVLATSPWHLQFSRAGADVAVSSFFVIFGIMLFLRHRLKLAAVCLAATFYSYYAERFFVPLLVLTLAWYSWRRIKHVVPAILIAAISLAPIAFTLVSPGQQNKIRITTLFGYTPPQEDTQRLIRQDASPILYWFFHNPLVFYTNMVASRYFNHFSPGFLFIAGPNDNRQRIEGMGMLYWTDPVWLAAGLLAMKKIGWRNRNVWFIILWLVLSPLPAAITRDPVHARRAFNLVYPLSILVGSGMWYLLRRPASRKWLILLIPFAVWSVGFYFLSYYRFTPTRTYQGSAGWQYGYKQLVQSVSPLKNKYAKVVVDNSYQGPYAFFLFYEKYPPKDYQPQAKLVKTDPNGLGENTAYANYEFRNIFWPSDRGARKTLFAASPQALPLKDIDPKQARLLETIYFPDKTPAFHVVETF